MKLIDFYGDTLEVVEMEGGPGVTARRLVENLGLEWSGQLKKLEDPIYACVHMYTTGSDDKKYEMMVMPVKSLPAFLFSINPKKVREDLRENRVDLASRRKRDPGNRRDRGREDEGEGEGG